MAIFKCKMCGGALEINNNETVAVCEYCGTKQTLPKLDDEKRVQLYDRANHFRRENEFDKAMGIYEMILSDDKEDCESYWGIVLCRYGIEYVEDPRTHKRIPTVNRAQFTSIFDDDDYKNAIKYADGYQKDVYEAEASVIDKIQKGILEISNKEEPFDVFICYKETDSHGNRTQDSVYAQDIYAALTKEGYKVFFSRITLEDKLGSAYEPYIFAALNSAKVMLVVGTEKDNFNAVWVKNEWSRYISLIKAGKDKTLIPVYKDISPYDMPEEFQYLQSQDMGKIGFMQDLIRGIKKIAQADAPKTTVVKETVISGGNANTAPLLKRAFMFLEDGDWNSANEYCEKVLDIDPENASAYLGKLLSELRVRKQESLKDQAEPFDHNNNYQKAIRFADEKLKTVLAGYIEHINTRNENARLDGVYTRAKNAMSAANTESAYKEAAHLFESIREYQDSAVLAQSCYEKAEIARKDTILSEGKSKMSGEIISNYESAIKLFETISGWKDSAEQIYACQKRIEEIKAKEDAERLKEEAERLEKERQAEIARKEAERIAKRNKKIAIITTSIVCAIIAFVILLNTVIIPNVKYNDAMALMDAGKYSEAILAFEAMDGYKDSLTKIDECNYNKAVLFSVAGNLDEAYESFVRAGNYKDSYELLAPIAYSRGVKLLDEGKIREAMGCFVNARGYESAENYLINWNAKTISAGANSIVGLKSNGTVVAVVSDVFDDGQGNVSGWTDIVAISAGDSHTVGLKSDGTVVAVGDNYNGQCNVDSWTDIVAISAGRAHTVGLKSDGTVVAVGDNHSGECDVSDWTDIVAISACSGYTIGLKSNGTVVATGLSDDKISHISNWTDIIAIDGDSFDVFGLKSNGTVVNIPGAYHIDASKLTNVVAISAGTKHTVVLNFDGTVFADGTSYSDECNVDSWTDIVAISAGDEHTVGLKSDGTVVAKGFEVDSVFDVTDWTDIKQPTKY